MPRGDRVRCVSARVSAGDPRSAVSSLWCDLMLDLALLRPTWPVASSPTMMLPAGPSAAATARNADQSAAALVVGASRGIGFEVARALSDKRFQGQVFCAARRPTQELRVLCEQSERCQLLSLDVTDEESIEVAAKRVKEATGGTLDLLLNTAGLLHDGDSLPERSLRAVNAHWMQKNFAVNAVGPMLLAKHFAPLLAASVRGRAQSSARQPIFASLSARVGSIGDNSLGGWHSYRVSKAAQNMALRTAAVELSPRGVTVLALHPGTVATDLSAPFSELARSKYTIFPPAVAAAHVLDVLDAAEPADSGSFFAWDKKPIPW